MGVCFHWGSAFGEHGGAIFLRAFEKKKLFGGIFVGVSSDM